MPRSTSASSSASGTLSGNAPVVIKPSSDSVTGVQIEQAGGNPVVTVDTTNQRVGIGTTAPGRKLDVQDSNPVVANFQSSATQSIIDVENGTTTNLSIIRIYAGSTGWMLGQDGTDSNKLKFDTNISASFTQTKVTIQQNGNVGIGNTSPAALLDLTSTSSGFLPPRMTTTQKNAISSPTEGMVVYDATLHKLCVRTASAWETVTSA